jgi:hypothetical protein
MGVVGAAVGVALIVLVLVDGFETMILPRRVTRPYRYARLYYRGTWALWRGLALRFPAGRRRHTFLSLFGPLSLLGLIITWVIGLILGFALLHWALGSPLQPGGGPAGFGAYLYLSGSTFFTLGYGDVAPADRAGRGLAVGEAALGFAFLAVVISYLPVLYQAFSRREVTIALLDARAGSPPTAAQALVRLGTAGELATLDPFLAEWERWAAEVLESHLSFPVLSYYRSQHDNQSWLAALTAVLDTCALLMAGVKGAKSYQARLTFAVARHAAVDLALVFHTPPRPPDPERLPAERLRHLRELLRAAGLELRAGAAAEKELAELRALYEPFVNALAERFLFALPPVVSDKPAVDNWQTSAWTHRTPGLGSLPGLASEDEHFE